MAANKVISTLFLLFLWQSAFAFENDPGACVHVAPSELFNGKVPTGFVLVKPCTGAKDGVQGVSSYFFRGEATISGIVRYEETVTFGPWAEFNADLASRHFLPEQIFVFDLDRTKSRVATKEAFGFPELQGKGRNCWQARATIHIKDISSINDDTDNSGNSVERYKVIKIGKYTPCKAETDD
jgi:hypothetical protein